MGSNIATTYITCPADPNKTLGIKLPFLVMILKNLKKYFSFEVTVLDDKEVRRRFRASNYQSTTRVKPFICTMPMRLEKDSQQNIQIHDGFLAQEQKDTAKEKQVKANKDMSALPMNMLEGKWLTALDKDLKTKMLVQVRSDIVDPCGSITCGSLSCPAGFSEESVPGHCCPYCVNPNIVLEREAVGATGSHGGKASAMPTCKNVWCFPTMCTVGETAPTTTNGACCSTCPAL